MERIAVIGCAGAGKSTFSRKLAEMLELPLYHLDAFYWKPGWVPSEKEEWHDFMENLVSEEKWIIDGNYGRTMDARLERADTVIFLDMPRVLCMYRVLKRRLQYHGRARPDMNEGCPEKLDMEFIKWVWGYQKKNRPETVRRLNGLQAHKQIIILKRPAEARRFVTELQRERAVD